MSGTVTCANCGRQLTPKRSTARFCSGACRVAALRRKREAPADGHSEPVVRSLALQATTVVTLTKPDPVTVAALLADVGDDGIPHILRRCLKCNRSSITALRCECEPVTEPLRLAA